MKHLLICWLVVCSTLFVLADDAGVVGNAADTTDAGHWAYRDLERPEPPALTSEDLVWSRNPIDRFVAGRRRAMGLGPAPQADRRTLIRRLHFDLVGLPPTPEAVERFVEDRHPLAYERLVDELLASPHYGETWARHWLDVVHYGDTHGYDKDKLRPNAWPYRDYVIRSFNEDKPWSRFIREQIAGDVLFPNDPDGIVALGFLAAGPWDFIGHVEVSGEKIDGQRTRNLDRDDMVSTVMNTFVSTTVQCARCHEHKFDPVTMEDYYSLQAVFAAVDRADRSYDPDPEVAARRAELERRRSVLRRRAERHANLLRARGGDALARLDEEIRNLEKAANGDSPAFGFHSGIEPREDIEKWVRVDLGESRTLERVRLFGARDGFNGIGDGFGFPVRWKVEVSDDVDFSDGDAVRVVADWTDEDFANPGIEPVELETDARARYIRVTATRLAPRREDYIFALAELEVWSDGRNVARNAAVTSGDTIEAPPRWGRTNLTDGIAPALGGDPERLEMLRAQREALLRERLPDSWFGERARLERETEEVDRAWSELPEPRKVFAAATEFPPEGNHRPTGGDPRVIRVLHRGEVTRPREVVGPGTFSIGLPSRFDPNPANGEAGRRARLAEWIANPENPLTWRSIVNRVWQYHFGRGLVETPNDFGRMGADPTHPGLLDWLAVEFRDRGQSLKHLHRLIVTSATYRQSSERRPDATEIDGGNRFLWRMNRRRLTAEGVRDAVLAVAGKLDPRMHGPGFREFVLEKPQHSPHYVYDKHDPDDPSTHRRSIYRFLARSSTEPFMTTLDCADPSIQTARRGETLTPLQSLALLNNKFMIAMSEHFASRLEGLPGTMDDRVERAFQLALARAPTERERMEMAAFAREHGWVNACRLLYNLNEFLYID